MKIKLAKSAGFCFGVKRAIEIAFKTSASGKKVCMLGDIVHNEEVVKAVEKSGVKKIKGLGYGKNRILLVRAHGIGSDIINNALKRGYEIVDATCPMVKEIHRIAKEMEQAGFTVIIIGDKKHDEVLGIVGQLKSKAIIIDDIKHIPFKKIKGIEKAAVLVQSTQDYTKVIRILGRIKPYIKKLKFFNTICRPTTIKQEEIKKMPLENDVMIIIGSKNSANTKRLYQISRALNKKSFWIQSKKDLKNGWFKNAKSIGITAGASTPDGTIRQITSYIIGNYS